MTIQIFYVPGKPYFYESFNDILIQKDYYLIKYINCSGCNLTELPTILPSGLIGLYCENNLLTYLPELPYTLQKLRCDYNNLCKLPELPTTLDELCCSYNKLSELPVLGDEMYYTLKYMSIHNSRLRKLICNNNRLTVLPAIPCSLYHLECKNNLLTQLPQLPIFIRTLDISYNKFKMFPKNITHHLGLITFNCNNNKITHPLPCLPESIMHLNISNNPIKTISNLLPDKLHYFDLSNTLITSIPNIPKCIQQIVGIKINIIERRVQHEGRCKTPAIGRRNQLLT